MHSSRFYANLPYLTSSQSDTSTTESSNSTLSKILDELKQQGTAIKYLEAQKDVSLQLGDTAQRYFNHQAVVSYPAKKFRSIEQLTSIVNTLSQCITDLENAQNSSYPSSSDSKSAIKCPKELSVCISV